MINLTELIEVTLPEPDNFLKVKETLSRIGIASKKDNTLYQSCHILHKQGKYYIIHFKELFLLDGKKSDFSLDDKARRNTIANLLDEWQLVDLVDPAKSADPVASLSQIKVLPYKEKSEWTLVTKYSIGSKKEY
ncbi:translation repressor protein [bacterium]|nr:translation repressor protein [bacterium]